MSENDAPSSGEATTAEQPREISKPAKRVRRTSAVHSKPSKQAENLAVKKEQVDKMVQLLKEQEKRVDKISSNMDKQSRMIQQILSQTMVLQKNTTLTDKEVKDVIVFIKNRGWKKKGKKK